MEGGGEGERAVAWLEEIMARYNTKLFEKVPIYDTGACVHTNYNCIHKKGLLCINTAWQQAQCRDEDCYIGDKEFEFHQPIQHTSLIKFSIYVSLHK